jgi:hypothetical protein
MFQRRFLELKRNEATEMKHPEAAVLRKAKDGDVSPQLTDTLGPGRSWIVVHIAGGR